jgi:hypothetical protein
MALPTTITVTDSGGPHAIPIPAGWAIYDIRLMPVAKKNANTGPHTLEISTGDGRRHTFYHGDVTGITVA